MGEPTRRGRSRMTSEQRGIAAAILVAFVGVAIGGPALLRAEARRKRALDRLAAGLDETRARAQRMARHGRRRLRRLGGGTIWR